MILYYYFLVDTKITFQGSSACHFIGVKPKPYSLDLKKFLHFLSFLFRLLSRSWISSNSKKKLLPFPGFRGHILTLWLWGTFTVCAIDRSFTASRVVKALTSTSKTTWCRLKGTNLKRWQAQFTWPEIILFFIRYVCHQFIQYFTLY